MPVIAIFAMITATIVFFIAGQPNMKTPTNVVLLYMAGFEISTGEIIRRF